MFFEKPRRIGRRIRKSIARVSLGQIWQMVSRPGGLKTRFFSPEWSDLSEISQFLFPGVPEESVERTRLDFLKNHGFFERINEKFLRHRGRRTNFDGWLELLYMMARRLKPRVIVETGIFDGHSSAAILQALHDNNKGALISIDLPAYEPIKESTHRMRDSFLPPGLQPGWIIPDYLRVRHTLALGDSRIFLPQVLEKFPEIDIFLHDSLHTYEHQKFEYETAWPHLAPGGILLSDDVSWTPAFHEFSKNRGRYKIFHGLGILRKENK